MKHRTEEHRDRLDAHIFVCTNDRSGEHACCADVDGEAVTERVKAWLRERDLFWSSVSVSTTSCLGLCSAEGAALTIQPRNEWYSDIDPEEVPKLLESEFGPEASDVSRD